MADAAPEFTSEAGTADKSARMEQRRKWLVRLGLAVLILGAVYGLYYVLVGRNHVGTDNAYVNAEIAEVTPLISAQFAQQ